MFNSRWRRKLEESRDWCLSEAASKAKLADNFWEDKKLSDIFWELSKAYENAAKNIDERLNAK